MKDLTNEELVDKILDIINEFAVRFVKDPKGHADEFVAIKDIELAISELRKVLEYSGRLGDLL